MKRELNKLLSKHQEIKKEWFNMTVENSTSKEKNDKWNELQKCRYEIAEKCIEILGIRTRDQAIAFSESISRHTGLYKFIKKES